MQPAQIVHSLIAVFFIAVILGHIYIGTLGMEGAFEAMGTGSVDLNWAKEHHRLWLEEEIAKGRVPNQPAAATPAERNLQLNPRYPRAKETQSWTPSHVAPCFRQR